MENSQIRKFAFYRDKIFQERKDAVNLGPFVGMDFNLYRPSMYPLSYWHELKMNQTKRTPHWSSY